MLKNAVLSDCGFYRYRLTRRWGVGRKVVNFIMLNPSTADATVDDPTVTRCIKRARAMELDALVVTNLFAYRSPHPKDLMRAPDPIGPLNDMYLWATAGITVEDGGLVVLGWGARGGLFGRDKAVLRLLRGLPLMALRETKDGAPGHPLYVPLSTLPFTYSAAA